MDFSVKGLKASAGKAAEGTVKYYRGLEPRKRALLIVGIVLLLIALCIGSVYLVSPHYVPLYTNLDTQSEAEIAGYLKDKKVPYQLGDQGSTILVPEAQKYQIRLDLANNNLPKGKTVGFESFDTTHFGETETEQQVRYIAALQGELERTIGEIDGVEDVRVHVVKPEQSLFVKDQKDATASVLLKLKPGWTLKDNQVQGITRLVANGVEGLKPENVSVVDTEGHILSDNLGTGGNDQKNGKLTSDQLQIKSNYEQEQQRSIQAMLERVVGSGQAVVRVNANFNFDQIQINTETYGDKQVRSSHVIDETGSSNAGAAGLPGTSSNISTYQQAGNPGTNQTQKNDKTTNYEVDKQTVQRVVAPGQLRQLSVSVLLGKKVSPDQQNQIQSMVAAAAGIQPQRGDQVTVAALPFNTDEADQMKKEEAAGKVRSLIIFMVIALLAAGLLAYLISRIKRPRQEEEAEEEQMSEQEATVQDLMATKKQEMPVENPQDEERRHLLEQLRKLATDKPDETIKVLRSWLKSE